MATMAYQGWAIWDSAAAVELLAKLDEPNRTTLQRSDCQAPWAELSNEGLFLSRKLVRLNSDPIVSGLRIGTKWAGGVTMPPQWSLRLANWTRAWTYFKTTDCVDKIGLYTAQSQGFAVKTTTATPSTVRLVTLDITPERELTASDTSLVRASGRTVPRKRTNTSTPAPAPEFVIPPEEDEYNPEEYVFEEVEPEGLSTGAKVGFAVGAVAVVSGLLWATTKKRR